LTDSDSECSGRGCGRIALAIEFDFECGAFSTTMTMPTVIYTVAK